MNYYGRIQIRNRIRKICSDPDPKERSGSDRIRIRNTGRRSVFIHDKQYEAWHHHWWTCFHISSLFQEEDEEIYYDKKKSFFDNISCEAVERSKG